MLKKLMATAVVSAFAAMVTAGAVNAAIYDTGFDSINEALNGAVDGHWAVAQVGGNFADNFGKLSPIHA